MDGFPLLENGYSVKGMASCVIKSGDLFLAADNYWCLVTCQKWMDGESPRQSSCSLHQSSKSDMFLSHKSQLVIKFTLSLELSGLGGTFQTVLTIKLCTRSTGLFRGVVSTVVEAVIPYGITKMLKRLDFVYKVL